MELNEFRSELHRLSSLVAGWSAPEDITAIERDLALAKLRNLYEALRYDGVAADAGTTGGDASDFAAALALEPFSLEPDVTFGEQLDDEAEPGGAEPAEEEPDVEVELIFAEESYEEGAAADDVSEEPESEAEASADAPRSAETPIEEDLPESGRVAADSPAEEFEHAESVPAEAASALESPAKDQPATGDGPAADTAVPVPSEAAESVPERAALSAAEPEAQPAATIGAPTLFGVEDATKRHRHRQRVIMSLYDADPAVPLRSEPAVADAVSPAVASQPEPSQVEAPVPEEDPVSAPERLAAVQSAPSPESCPIEPQPAAAADSVSAEAECGAGEPARVDADFARTGAVLGEVINHDVRTLGETIAPSRGEASELARTEPVTDLRRAIGINDKFLLLRDLFGGDAAAYDRAVDALNDMESLDECMIWIAEHYAWNANCDGAKLLMELLERKYA